MYMYGYILQCIVVTDVVFFPDYSHQPMVRIYCVSESSDEGEDSGEESGDDGER